MKTRIPCAVTVLGLLLLVTAVPGMAQSCPRGLADNPCSIDLLTGTASSACSQPPFVQITTGPADSNGDGWWETVLHVNLGQEDEQCERVCVVLDYVEQPTGFTLDIGDSSTNNGQGGNNGTVENETELQILNQRLTLFSRSYGPGLLDRVAEADLQLENGSYKVCVSDQHASFGQPLSSASTPNGQALFAFPDTGTASTPHDGNVDLFIGLNRVIHNLAGLPSAGRIGTGLRRAYITVE